MEEPPVTYIPVSVPEAVRQLCVPTGDERVDDINSALIDLLQRGYIFAVRTETDPSLRYGSTEAGGQFVEDYFQQAVDSMLGGIFDDRMDGLRELCHC